ncbi:hypothetical protein SteCoe_17679 [Stentor coeruleus]|uniref:Uncharacterized protein n=1 Tax=Stentor coeruleus TaxID=5963 RepID=A0A1R2BYU1_9CILI|nr:hypothetical protein SteCoe_17679 [Stentor coeruleus]
MIRNENTKHKKNLKDNSSATKCSDDESENLEFSLTELSDNSITLYSTIQSIWHEYQTRLSAIPCLDLLAAMATQEFNDKNS